MKQNEDQRSNRSRELAKWLVPIIAALISAYAGLIAADKIPNPFNSINNQTAEISGIWVGKFYSEGISPHIETMYSIQPDCQIGAVCGYFDRPQIDCRGNLVFNGVLANDTIYEFVESKTSDGMFCSSTNTDKFTVYSRNELSVTWDTGGLRLTGIFARK